VATQMMRITKFCTAPNMSCTFPVNEPGRGLLTEEADQVP